MAYKGADFYLSDELFSEEEILIRDSVRQFVTDQIMPIIAKHNQEGTFPAHLVPGLGELGLLGASLEGYGCAGVSATAYGLMMVELERGDSGIRSFVSVQGALCMYPIYRFGSEEQKQHYLPDMAKGKAIGSFGLTEADFGSNPGGLRTRAEKTAGGYLLNGSKYWITNGTIADVSIIWAKLDGVIRGFLVDKGTRGFSAQDIKGKFSLRASVTSELFLQDVEVPESDRLPKAEGLRAPLSCLTQARYGIAWGAIGAAMACYDEVVTYTRDRLVQGGPLAGKQLTQEKLAFMLTEITKAQLLALRVAQLKDEGKLHHAMVSMAKRNNVDIALQVARQARDLLGANGIVDDYQSMRHMMNLETVRTYEGTHDIHTLILGKEITGIAAL